MFTNRAIYHDGWVACSRFGVPWETAGREGDFLTAPWELYNIEDDFSQADDLAAKNPEKLKELQAKFLEEAKKYDVFPLDPRFAGAAWIRSCGCPASRRRAGPTTATTSGCRSRSGRNSSREPTPSPPN